MKVETERDLGCFMFGCEGGAGGRRWKVDLGGIFWSFTFVCYMMCSGVIKLIYMAFSYWMGGPPSLFTW